MSQASDKQKRINELLNASHNSQAERDYLRKRILEIFEEDEKALDDLAKDVPPRRQRKKGRSKSIDGATKQDEGFHEPISEEHSHSLVHNESNATNTTSGLGSDDLQSRTSLQFINVTNSEDSKVS